jgi:hypothetical protein
MLDAHRVVAEQLRGRFGILPNICWDLCNEPNIDVTRLSDYLQEIRPKIAGSEQMCGIGVFSLDDSLRLGEGTDWHSIHISCCKTPETLDTGKPCILQEGWAPTPTDSMGQTDVETALNQGISRTFAGGGAGFFPWNWNRIANRWRAECSFVESWDYELGVAAEDDDVPRRGEIVLRNWATLLDGIEFDQTADRQVVVVSPARTVECDGMFRTLKVLSEERIAFSSVNDRDVVRFDSNRTRLVVLPYGGIGWRESTWQWLQTFVRDGGTVWAHVDRMLFDERGARTDRQIPWIDRAERREFGRFEWVLGWNRDQTVKRFENLIRSFAFIRREPERFPLVGGGRILFTFRASSGEQSMRTDWIPYHPLPEQRLVTKVDVRNASGDSIRGFASGGESFRIGRMTIRSENPFFFLSPRPGELLVSGTPVMVSDRPGVFESTLVSILPGGVEKPLDSPSKRECADDNAIRFQQQGWQRRHWTKICFSAH